MPDTQDKRPESKAGPEAYLSSDERKALQRSLSFPEDLPPKFKSWLIDFIAVNIPQIPVSQIVGFNQVEQVEVFSATTNASTGSITSTTYGSTGPTVSALRAGSYTIIFGALVSPGAIQETGRISVSLNGAAPSDDDAIWFNGVSPAEVPATRAVVKSLTGTTNTVALQYRSTGGQSVAFSRRWVVVQRIGPA